MGIIYNKTLYLNQLTMSISMCPNVSGSSFDLLSCQVCTVAWLASDLPKQMT